MHAAAALDKGVYALFGPTNPVETGPYGAGHHVFTGRCAQRPCFKTDCATLACMRSITPAIVYGYIQELPPGDQDCCDVATTGFSGGTWKLDAAMGRQSNSYVNEAAASMIRKVFDQGYHPGGTPNGDAGVREASLRFVQQCIMMEQVLVAFRNSHSAATLRQFELLRKAAAEESGINAFWNAVLNIRLNSVPLLDPVAGIEGSIAACHTTRRQIAGCFQV